MGILDLFMTTKTVISPPSRPTLGEAVTETPQTEQTQISGFLSVESFSNFAAMTGAITAAWHGLQQLFPPWGSKNWVPYVGAFIWAVISVLITIPGLAQSNPMNTLKFWSSLFGAIFVAAINALVLGSAVVGANVVTTPGG